MAEQYFTRTKTDDLEGVLSLYSPRFFAATSLEQWLRFLEDQRSRCGTPRAHSLVNWNVFNSIGSNSGTRITLVYDVKYSSCRVFETLIVVKPSGGKMQIQGHFMKPKEIDPLERRDSTETFRT